MSFRLVQKVIKSDRVEGMHKLVLVILADFVNEDRDAGVWPAKSTIANLAGCTPRHVTRIIRGLEQDGVLKTVARAGLKGTNRYYIRLDAPVDNSVGGDKFDTLGVTNSTPRGDTSVMGEVTFETQGGDTHVTQTYKEQIRTDKATSVVRPSGAADALVGNAWENLTAKQLPCNHDNTITVNACPECFKQFRFGEWKPNTPNVA